MKGRANASVQRTTSRPGRPSPRNVSYVERSPFSRRFQTEAARKCSEAVARWVPHVMRCKNPYMGSGMQAYGCGQCLPCRINKRREWAHRIMLEASQNEDNAFVTLTYADPAIGPPVRSLIPSHGRNWLKRIRYELGPLRTRYFFVGEYGDQSERPHFHAALFNFPACRNGFTIYRRGRSAANCCEPCRLVSKTWPYGNTYIGKLEPHSAAYIAGYVTKKWTRKDDHRLKGRHPEYARMSLKPGLGADVAPEVASFVLGISPAPVDVPAFIQYGKRKLPLGRYLTRLCRIHAGREAKTPIAVIQAQAEKLRHLYEMAEIDKIKNPYVAKKELFKNRITNFHAGLHARIEAIEKLHGQRKRGI